MALTTINGNLPLIIVNNTDDLIIRKSKMGDLSANFSRSEFACKCGCGFQTVDVELLEVITSVREKFRKPVTINSACRCDEHNKKIGGSYGSKHKQGIAADIVVKGVNPDTVYAYLDDMYPTSFGMGKYESFTHIDVRRTKARWKG
jgi:uncharacterized protein YcbK (DUF882 family)